MAALALLFGEAVMLTDISIVGLIGMTVETVEEGHRQINRYARLTLDEDDGRTSDHLELIREGDKVWLKATSEAYVNYPLLTESGFARSVCGARANHPAMRCPVSRSTDSSARRMSARSSSSGVPGSGNQR